MTEKRFNLRAGYYDEYTGICGGNDENFTTNEVVYLLNEQDEAINELKYSNHSRAKIIIRLIDKINQLEKKNTDLKQYKEWQEEFINDMDRLLCDKRRVTTRRFQDE